MLHPGCKPEYPASRKAIPYPAGKENLQVIKKKFRSNCIRLPKKAAGKK